MDATAEELIIHNSRGPLASRIFRGGGQAESGKPFDYTVSINYRNPDFRAVCERPHRQQDQKVQFPGVGAYVGRHLEGYTGGWMNNIKLYPQKEEFYVFATLDDKKWADFLAATTGPFKVSDVMDVSEVAQSGRPLPELLKESLHEAQAQLRN